jgi:FabA-like domain
MRLRFVDRIVELEPSRRIETLTRVSGLDDVFADHVPGYPVLPGALVVEAFAPGTDAGRHAERLGALARELREAPMEIANGE